MRITTELLSFEINGDGSRASFILSEKPEAAAQGSDFWRLILDDGLRTEIPVYAHKQHGRVYASGDALVAEYTSLVSEYGDTYPITFRVDIQAKDGLLHFTPSIENNAQGVRVNECFCPLADFNELCGDKAQDVIYMPDGLGTRAENPWAVLENMTGAYYAHDDKEVFWHLHYPRASMGWFGVESGSRFLYVARYDEKMRHCFLTARQRIHSEPTNLMLGVDHFPMARCGEALLLPTTVVGLLEGDWRKGADTYRAWANEHFFTVQQKAPWVQEMTGWQRIIMRSQYGEDYYKAEDLPAIYEAGAKHGIHTIFLFGWWKEGMDRNYPYYEEPYPGAFKALGENIHKVQAMGGRIILECNCHFLDPTTDYYREFGDEVKMLDINGNEVRPAFVYPGAGEFRVTYGAKQFPLTCSCTERWREQLMTQLRQMNDMGADCLFMDCFGGCPYQPCFNEKHEHGPRVDEEWVGHRKIFSQAREFCANEGKVLATEVVTDIAAAYNQFVHGLVNVDFNLNSKAFPQLFRYTFPEVITTERGIRHEEGAFAKQLKWALTMALRLDAELYVCRAALDRSPKYAAEIGKYTDTLNRYADYMLWGRFTAKDVSRIPNCVKRAEYIHKDGGKVLRVLYNMSDAEVSACGVTLAPDEMRFDEFDEKTYKA